MMVIVVLILIGVSFSDTGRIDLMILVYTLQNNLFWGVLASFTFLLDRTSLACIALTLKAL